MRTYHRPSLFSGQVNAIFIRLTLLSHKNLYRKPVDISRFQIKICQIWFFFLRHLQASGQTCCWEFPNLILHSTLVLDWHINSSWPHILTCNKAKNEAFLLIYAENHTLLLYTQQRTEQRAREYPCSLAQLLSPHSLVCVCVRSLRWHTRQMKVWKSESKICDIAPVVWAPAAQV